MRTLSSSGAGPSVYVPGYAAAKFCMLLLGGVMFVAGMAELLTPARLSVFGARANAEATQVVKTRLGAEDQVLHTPAEIEAGREPRDRSFTFWNEFALRPGDHEAVRVRSNVGSHVGPVFPLTDPDGLPTTELICYDPALPTQVVFPLMISTWVIGGLMTLGGLGFAIIGAVLFRCASRPIEMPYIPSANEVEALHAKPSDPKQ